MHKRFQSQKPPTTSAFTIIELLIVIVVIGILATITIVAYSNIQNRARTAALTSSLSQAATKLKTYDIEIGSYPESLTDINIHSSEAVTYTYHKDNNSNPRSFCITAIKNNLVYKVTDTTQPSPGGCSMHEWPGGVVMTNLVENGDFGAGTAGWLTTLTSLSASDNTLTAAVTTVSGAAAIRVTNLNIISGHKYYIAFQMNPFRSHNVYASVGTMHMLGVIPSDTFTKAAQVVEAGADSTVLTMRLNADTTSGMSVGSQVKYREVMLIDLTATFGSGNEPTKEQMDQILQQFPNSWFNGTVTANTQGIL